MIRDAGFTLFWTIVAAICVIVFVAIMLVFQPFAYRQQTYSIHQTYGYTEAAQQRLLQLDADYHKLQVQVNNSSDPSTVSALRGQQQADLDQMRIQSQEMDPSQVPTSVQIDLQGS